jgi:predicted RNase H-like nuclease (RuvC/YqgF family)
MKDSEILLAIRRKYSKDEAVEAYKKEISDLNIQIGILKSDLAEKDDIIDNLKKNMDEEIAKKVAKKTTKNNNYMRILESQIYQLKQNINNESIQKRH